MARGGLIFGSAFLLLATAGIGIGQTVRDMRRIEAGRDYEVTHRFRGGERACVIMVGDHKPPSPMEVRVFDAKNKLVAVAKASIDTAAVIWYPPVTASYRVEVLNLGDEYNDMAIYFQGAVKR
jgi:hypothetical protein